MSARKKPEPAIEEQVASYERTLRSIAAKEAAQAALGLGIAQKRCACGRAFTPQHFRQEECRHCEMAHKERERKAWREQLNTQTTVTLDDEFLRKLAQLCHPDKHGGSSLAVEVTTQLNALRSRVVNDR